MQFKQTTELIGFGENTQESHNTQTKAAEPQVLSEIDSNFKTDQISDRKYKFISYDQAPLELNGFAWFKQEHKLCRIPQKLFPDVNEGVRTLAWHCSGGMIRFRTNSKSIVLKAKLLSQDDMSHMPRSGSSGFDIYIGSGATKRYIKTAMPQGKTDTVEAEFNGDNMEEYTINFPLYNGVKELFIGTDPDAKIEAPTQFKYQKPILFYGSSITQGGCASRPGNSYTALLGRWLDANVINFGFSGSAKGEQSMAETIASLSMTAFVLDYDHNAPSPEHLQATHEKFFSIIREKNPVLPIIIVSKPDVPENSKNIRTDIIKKTYDNAIKGGDNKIYFIDGSTLFGSSNRDACTVDNCHPNDLGFMRMAETIYPVLKHAIGR